MSFVSEGYQAYMKYNATVWYEIHLCVFFYTKNIACVVLYAVV